LDGAMHVQKTRNQMSSGISHYVNEDYLRQQRAIYRLLDDIERNANLVRQQPPEDIVLDVQQSQADICLPFERPLYVPKNQTKFKKRILQHGESRAGIEEIMEQNVVDINRLKRNIDRLLEHNEQATLAEVISQYPLQMGIPEFLAYLDLANEKGEYLRRKIFEVLFTGQDEKKYILCAENVIFKKEA